MKYRSYLLIFLSALALAPLLSNAQFIPDYKRKGDQYFENKAYYAAAIYYQKALKILPDTSGESYYLPYFIHSGKKDKVKKDAAQYQYLVYKLGEAYRLYKDFKSAEDWYAKAVKFKNNRFPLAPLWYGVCLRADGKYRQAIQVLKDFQSTYQKEDVYNKRAGLELQSAQFALNDMKYPRFSEINKLPAPVNIEKGSHYAPLSRGDTLYFTSSRMVKGINDKKNNPYVNKIYASEVNKNGDFSKPKRLNLTQKKNNGVAALSVNSSQNMYYFTALYPVKNKRIENHYVIVSGEKNKTGGINSSIALDSTVNVTGYNSKDPFVTDDGTYLIFSSDRPGGFGGYDLWFCRLQNGRPVGKAINMGAVINSEGNDENPYYEGRKGKLVFSSDGRIGLGGFDLFESEGEIITNNWSEPVNMGYPVNSAKDDNYYYPTSDGKGFYTSSDRNSICCLELYNVKLKTLRLTGIVYDKKTKEPIENARIVLTDSIADKTMDFVISEANGVYSFNLKNRRPLKLTFSSDHYFTEKIRVTTGELRGVDSVYRQDAYLSSYEVNRPIVIPNILYDFDKATLRTRSKRVLDTLVKILNDNPEMIIRIGAHTDTLGGPKYNDRLSQRRAQSVVDYLIDKGIYPDRLKAKGYGFTRPVAPNVNPDGSDNPKGRQLNRRTDFTILSDKTTDSIYLKSTHPGTLDLEEALPENNYKGYNFDVRPEDAKENKKQ